MLRRIALGFTLGLTFALSSVVAARAEEVRVPATGDPAYAFTLPTGWTTSYDKSGSVGITGKTCGCGLSLSVVNIDTAANTPSQFATLFMKGAGARPYRKMEFGAIGGRPGVAFFSTMKVPTGMANLKLVIVKLDPSHYASLAVITPIVLSDKAATVLNSLLAGVRFTVARAEEARIPATGDPAYAFTVPAGWTTKYDPLGNLLLGDPSCSCRVSLSLVNVDTTATTTAQFAAEVIKAAGAVPDPRTEPGSIAGMPGDAFLTTLKGPATVVNFKLVLVKVDPSHLASMVVITPTAFSVRSAAVLDALLAQLQLTSAHAVEVRLPRTGDPAYDFTVPAAWTATYDDLGNLTISNKNCGCAVLLNVEGADTAALTTAQVAANALRIAGAPPALKSAPGTIGGIPGDAYFSTFHNPNGGLFDLKVVVAKLDPTHFAEMLVITLPEPSTASAAELDSLLAAIQFTGLTK